jgi:UTP--glucose-1-phosphate uridylyltransferase
VVDADTRYKGLPVAIKVRKAVFPVGGLGTRFLPATKAMPKEMLPVVDKPLIQYAVEEALAAGIEEIIFVTGRGKAAIEDFFDHSFELRQMLGARGKDAELHTIDIPVLEPGRVAYTRQQAPLGLGHAVWCARELVGDEPFAILLADDLVMADNPCLKQMVDVFEQTGGNVVAVQDVPHEHTNRYGILDIASDDGRLVEIKGLVEKPDPVDAPSTLSIIGRYILLPEVFGYLSEKKKGADGEIQLTDSMARMIGDAPFHGLRFSGRRFDCGDKAGFFEANVAFALARPELHDEIAAILQKYAAGSGG